MPSTVLRSRVASIAAWSSRVHSVAWNTSPWPPSSRASSCARWETIVRIRARSDSGTVVPTAASRSAMVEV
ncbi:hypothetical protein [Streptomyces sp. NPDC002057]|uniref:hypothetical protein n=1 Tax=Streptomyces sp. NPDC002057 TaxID=3154664 RepID=UPI00332BA057